MIDREAALADLANSIAEPVSKLLTELEKLLAGLSTVQHFDLTDPSTLGSAIHSALPSAVVAAHLNDLGWDIKTAVGPGNKLICKAQGDGARRDVVIEVHLAGPRGGVGKSRHQFATVAADGAPGYLPGFEIEAPASALMFLGLYPDAAFTRISAAYLMYADGVDRRCVKLELSRDVAAGERKDSETVGAKKVPGSKVKIKETAREKRDAGSKNKRGDGSSSA
ncbi:MAG: hypothetical protein J0H04_01420 [Hyphomicrobium denitrificans]|nr:hypothetical protein [Hyphomicrobium denitrificans]